MIKIFEMFSGYGGAFFALNKAEIDFECVGYSEIEKCAIQCYEQNHKGKNYGDCTKINPKDLPDFDLLTGGFPCQSFSIAGNREGFEAKNKGKLFFEIIRIAKEKNPRYMLLENVQGILSHNNGKTFEIILQELEKINYYVSWKLLFSKKQGTPQNRPRVWFACFKNKEDYNKFTFPENIKLKKSVKDILEDKVDEKYFLTEKQLKKFNNSTRYGNHKLFYECNISPTIVSMGKGDIPIIQEDFKIADYHSDEGLRIRKDKNCPTLVCNSSIPIMLLQSRSIDKPSIKKAIKKSDERWRRLTPKECFRLQGFFKDEININNLSDNKLYFLAGNGWDINVVSKIFTQMFKGNKNRQKNILDAFK